MQTTAQPPGYGQQQPSSIGRTVAPLINSIFRGRAPNAPPAAMPSGPPPGGPPGPPPGGPPGPPPGGPPGGIPPNPAAQQQQARAQMMQADPRAGLGMAAARIAALRRGQQQ